MTYLDLTPELVRVLNQEWLRKAEIYRRYNLVDRNRPGSLRRVGNRLKAAGQQLKARV